MSDLDKDMFLLEVDDDILRSIEQEWVYVREGNK